MLIGPVFNRELVITPRRARIYIARAAYVLALLILIGTAWLVLTGTQVVRDVGDMARFGSALLHVLGPLQLALAVFFSALLATSAVAQEKDRNTLALLLLTNLSNGELVLGGLLASLLTVFVLIAAALPVFMLIALFGGISWDQIGRVFAVTVASVLLCGSLGSTLALWREKTFQALAMTVLVLVLWLGVWEVVAAGVLGPSWLGLPTRTWAVAMSPWQAILAAVRPVLHSDPALGLLGNPVNLFLVAAIAMAAGLNVLAMARIRAWNAAKDTGRLLRTEEPQQRSTIWGAEHDLAQERGGIEAKAAPTAAGEAAAATRSVHAADRAPSRPVWDNPILWREMRTWAYGRKMLVIRVAFLVIFALVAVHVGGLVQGGQHLSRADLSFALLPLFCSAWCWSTPRRSPR